MERFLCVVFVSNGHKRSATMMKDYKELTRLIGRMLTVAFIVLKLTNSVDWSWWWILALILIFEV